MLTLGLGGCAQPTPKAADATFPPARKSTGFLKKRFADVIQPRSASAKVCGRTGCRTISTGDSAELAKEILKAVVVRGASETFALAWKHHQANDLAKAKELYREILQAEPGHADAWCFLGAAFHAEGKLADAEAAFRHAIQLVPTYASALNFLGILLAQQGKLDEAAANLQQLVRIQPADAEAQNNLGLVFVQQGRFDDAITCYRQALALRSDFKAARDNLEYAATQKKVRGQSPAPAPDSTPANKERAIPDLTRSWEAARTAVNQGVALARQGRIEEAKAHFEEAALLQPDNVDAHNDLGGVLVQQKRYDEAVGSFQKVLSLKPDHVEAHYNLGLALQKQGKVDEAIACYQQALRFQPSHLDAQNNVGNLFKEQERLNEALACYQQALRWHPNHAGTHFNRALVWLLQGNWSEGWPAYEWRWQTNEFPRYSFQQPRWNGEAMPGRTIFIYAEQGLGDTLHFVRYLPLVRQRCGRVIFQCQGSLARLLARIEGADAVVPRGNPVPAFDVQAPLLSLPGIFQTCFKTVPAQIPYLHADLRLIEHWQKELSALRGFKIGIAWQGSPTFRDDHRRSIPLAQFAPLATLPDVHLISLQKGPGTDQVPAFVARLSEPVRGRFHDLGPRIDEVNGPFMDTAAIIKNLDLVVSSDTAVPHLAGALGMPVWVALPKAPDWRWLLQRNDSLWYPTMRLYRQGQVGDWSAVFERIAADVKAKVNGRGELEASK